MLSEAGPGSQPPGRLGQGCVSFNLVLHGPVSCCLGVKASEVDSNMTQVLDLPIPTLQDTQLPDSMAIP